MRSRTWTTSWSTVARGHLRLPARPSTTARHVRVTIISFSCIRMSCCTRCPRSNARRQSSRPIIGSGWRERSVWSAAGDSSVASGIVSILIGEHTNEPVDVDADRRGAVHRAAAGLRPRAAARRRCSRGTRTPSSTASVCVGMALRVCAVDVPLTHNSLWINTRQPRRCTRRACAQLPRRTAGPERQSRRITRCATVRRRGGLVPRHGWRVRWLRESVAVHFGRRDIEKGTRCVLGDIRWCIDDVLVEGDAPLLIVNVDRDGTFVDDQPDPLVLKRLDYRKKEMSVTSGPPETAVRSIRSAPEDANVLVSGLSARDLRSFAPHLWDRRGGGLLGFRREIGYWLLVGPSAVHAATRLQLSAIDARRDGIGHAVTARRVAAGGRGGESEQEWSRDKATAARAPGNFRARRGHGDTAISASCSLSARSRCAIGRRCSESRGCAATTRGARDLHAGLAAGSRRAPVGRAPLRGVRLPRNVSIDLHDDVGVGCCG